MKKRVIRLELLNDLYDDFQKMGDKGESFRQFVEGSGSFDEENNKILDWEVVDEINLIGEE